MSDLCYEVGPEASFRMYMFTPEILIPTDTVDTLKENLSQILYLAEGLAKDKTDPHYEEEMMFSDAVLYISQIFRASISHIEDAINACDRCMSDLNSSCQDGVVYCDLIEKYHFDRIPGRREDA